MIGIQSRKTMAIILKISGKVMPARGIEFSRETGQGWQGIVPALIAGFPVFASDFVRYRYLRQG